MSTPRFPLGHVVATPGALNALSESGQDAHFFLARHVCCNWGDLCPEDRAENTRALQGGMRILSSYKTLRSADLWVITEADRSATTILLPEEY